jgi:heptosyltransferase-2
MARPAGRGPAAGDGSTLVIQTAFLGDVVLTTPLLQALAARHGPVDVVTTPGAAALLEADPSVRRVIRFDKHGRDRGLRGAVALARTIRDTAYARAYLPHRSWRTAAIAMLARIPERVGFADAPANVLYTRRVPRVGMHETDRLLSLAGAGAYPVTIGITDDDRASAQAWMISRDVPERFVAVAPGSIWGTKRWPGYPALAALLDDFVVVVGGPEDRHLGDDVVAGAPGRVANAAGALPLRASAALIERAAALVTNDSAPLHLAQATRTPTVAIFGPTVTTFGFGPRGPADRVIEVEGLPCRPCSLHGPQQCPLGHHRCMQDISVDAVADAVRRITTAT